MCSAFRLLVAVPPCTVTTATAHLLHCAHPSSSHWLRHSKPLALSLAHHRRKHLKGTQERNILSWQDFATSWTNLTEQSQGRISSFRDFDWGAKMAM